MDEMKAYIGTKIIKAYPMDEYDFKKEIKGEKLEHENSPGYLVIYDNNYKSWSPKNVFEAAYREITDNEKNLIKDEKSPVKE